MRPANGCSARARTGRQSSPEASGLRNGRRPAAIKPADPAGRDIPRLVPDKRHPDFSTLEHARAEGFGVFCLWTAVLLAAAFLLARRDA